jgi:hypothetical protein
LNGAARNFRPPRETIVARGLHACRSVTSTLWLLPVRVRGEYPLPFSRPGGTSLPPSNGHSRLRAERAFNPPETHASRLSWVHPDDDGEAMSLYPNIAGRLALGITVPPLRLGVSFPQAMMLWSSLAPHSSWPRQTSAGTLCLEDFWRRDPCMHATEGCTEPVAPVNGCAGWPGEKTG